MRADRENPYKIWLHPLVLAAAFVVMAVPRASSDIYDDFTLGMNARDEGDFELAIHYFSLVEAQQPPRSTLLNVYIWRGRTYMSLDQYDRAIEDFDRAIPETKYPDIVHLYRARGTAYYWLGQYDHAIADAAQLISFYPDDYYAYAILARIFEVNERYDLAVKAYDEVIRIEPYVLVYRNRGLAHLLLEHYDLALEDLYETIRLDPEDPMNHFLLVLAYKVIDRSYERGFDQDFEYKPDFSFD